MDLCIYVKVCTLHTVNTHTHTQTCYSIQYFCREVTISAANICIRIHIWCRYWYTSTYVPIYVYENTWNRFAGRLLTLQLAGIHTKLKIYDLTLPFISAVIWKKNCLLLWVINGCRKVMSHVLEYPLTQFKFLFILLLALLCSHFWLWLWCKDHISA